MVDLKPAPAKPLRRGIPGTPYFVEISAAYFTVKIISSRRPGVTRSLKELIGHLATPESAPAKFHGDPMAYLDWVAKKTKKR